MADEKPHPRWTDTDRTITIHELDGSVIHAPAYELAVATLPNGKKLRQGAEEEYADFLDRVKGQIPGADPLA